MNFTDGNRIFPVTCGIANLIEVPPVPESEKVIIRIGYKIRDMADWAAWRTREFTPTNVPSMDKSWANYWLEASGRHFVIKSGGAAKFLECIIRKAIPLNESSYRASPANRGLYTIYRDYM